MVQSWRHHSEDGWGGGRRYRGRSMDKGWRGRVFSLFIDNLPLSVDHVSLRAVFERWGRVVDVFIPRRLRKRVLSRFGFVRFSSLELAKKVACETNGLRLFDNKGILVKIADYGLERRNRVEAYERAKSYIGGQRQFSNGVSNGDGLYSSREVHGIGSEIGAQRKTYRQVLLGANLGCNFVVDSDHNHSVMKAVEAITSRVADLEIAVAKLQHDFIYARCVGLVEKDQKVEDIEGEGGIGTVSDGGFSGMPVLTSEISYAREDSSRIEADGSNQDTAAVRVAGDEWPAGSRDDGETGVINDVGGCFSEKEDK